MATFGLHLQSQVIAIETAWPCKVSNIYNLVVYRKGLLTSVLSTTRWALCHLIWKHAKIIQLHFSYLPTREFSQEAPSKIMGIPPSTSLWTMSWIQQLLSLKSCTTDLPTILSSQLFFRSVAKPRSVFIGQHTCGLEHSITLPFPSASVYSSFIALLKCHSLKKRFPDPPNRPCPYFMVSWDPKFLYHSIYKKW